MFKRPKLIIGFACFVSAVTLIARHVLEYKSGKNPTGLKLVRATLNIMTAILSIMSDFLEQKNAVLDDAIDTDFDDLSDSDTYEDCDICRA